MFGIGMPEMLMILVVALVVVGPKRLPELAKTIGRVMGKLRSVTNDFQREIEKGTQPVRDINPFADGENSIQPPQATPTEDDTGRDTDNPPPQQPENPKLGGTEQATTHATPPSAPSSDDTPDASGK